MNTTSISLLSIFITNLFAGSIVSPLLPSVSSSFPAGGTEFAQLFLTIPSLVVIPFLFFSSVFTKFTSKRKLIILGLCLYIISGIGCIFSFNELSLIIFRSISGIGAGLVIPYGAALISDYYIGEKRDKILGYTGVIAYVAGVIFLTIMGFLAELYWKLGFLVFMFALIPIYLLLKYIKDVNKYRNIHIYPFKFTWTFRLPVWQCIIYYFFVMISVFLYFSELPFIIHENKLGGISNISLCQSIFMIAAIFPNFFMGYLKNKLDELFYFLQYFALAIGIFLLSLSASLNQLYLASVFIGLGLGSIGGSLIAIISDHTSSINRINALSIFTASMYFAQFLSHIIFNYIKKILSLTTSDGILLAISIIYLLVSFVIMYKYLKNYRDKQ